MLIKITSPPWASRSNCAKNHSLESLLPAAPTPTQRRALEHLSSDLGGSYVVYNNEIDLTWWQCHITKYCHSFRHDCRAWEERKSGDGKTLSHWYDSLVSVSSAISLRNHESRGKTFIYVECIVGKRFIFDGINQAEQVFVSLRAGRKTLSHGKTTRGLRWRIVRELCRFAPAWMAR